MLSVAQTVVITEVVGALAARADPELALLASKLNAVLLESAQHRASVSATRSATGETRRRGAPAKLVVIDTGDGAVLPCTGVRGARQGIVDTLTALGEPRRFVPSVAGLASAISKKGSWDTLVETANGTVTVTARYATDKEAADYAAWQASKETGT